MSAVYSIGHSSHPISKFLSLLKGYSIQVVIDSRSYPHSTYAPQYDWRELRKTLRDTHIKYLFLGKELGGRPEGSEYYDSEGRVLYYRLAESASFRAGIERVIVGASATQIAILCSEEDPTNCHRSLLIGAALARLGCAMKHIRADGTVQSEESLRGVKRSQMTMFGVDPAQTLWKSTRSVLRKDQPKASSPH